MFEKGDKNGKLLAYLTADAWKHTAIPCISSSEGTVVRDREGIMQAFVSYYSDLYYAIPPYEHQVLEDCAIVVLTVESQLLAIVNFYVLPPFRHKVLYKVLEKVATH